MRQEEKIGRQIRQFVLENFLEGTDPADIPLDFPVMSKGVVDSVSMLMLINYLEETFGIEFEAHEIDRNGFDTFADMAARVMEKRGDSV